MSKRKSTHDADPSPDTTRRRSTRLKASAAQSQDATQMNEAPAKSQPKQETKPQGKSAKNAITKTALAEEKPIEPPTKKSRGSKKSVEPKPAPKQTAAEKTATDGASSALDGRQYWLLKAEPTSRLENGVDVKFSIDDLAAKSEPEPWDGIRAYAARNNLRAMKQGDLAFFYHSNCKEPAIVGTMEIVQEHSPDLTAHDPKAPYYDASSKPSDPKWSVVHVEFRSKFTVPIGLKELRTLASPGRPLENMQMLKQSRLSVSKVSSGEWEFLLSLAQEKEKSQ